MELLSSNECLHCVSGVVYFTILDHLEGLSEHACQGRLALPSARERATLDETIEEILNHNNLGEVLLNVGKNIVLDQALECFSRVSQDSSLHSRVVRVNNRLH